MLSTPKPGPCTMRGGGAAGSRAGQSGAWTGALGCEMPHRAFAAAVAAELDAGSIWIWVNSSLSVL